MDAGAYVVGVAPSRLTANDGGNSRTVGASLCSRRRARLASKEAVSGRLAGAGAIERWCRKVYRLCTGRVVAYGLEVFDTPGV